MSLFPPSIAAALLLSLSLPLAAAESGPRPGETALPEASAQVDVDGIPVPLRYRMYISTVAGATDAATTRLRSEVDLSAALSKLAEAVRESLPDQRCGRHGADNWVVKLREMSAETESDQLLLGLVADVQMWACVDLKILGDTRTELADARVWMELPLAVDAQPQRLQLRWGRPYVHAEGDLARAARLYFAARGEDLSAVLTDRLARLSPPAADFNLPALLLASGGRIHSARFVNRGGMPHVEVEIDAKLGIGTWMDALRGLWGWRGADQR